MPQQVDQKTVDPEIELSNVQRTYKKLAPICSVEKRAAGEPQLAPQEKQLDILAHELKETLLCVNLAKKGRHGVRDKLEKKEIHHSILEYEHMDMEMKDERNQQAELDCLNYLAKKQMQELMKKVPTEADELAIIEDAAARLRRMENRLDLAIKRFCVANSDNKQMREEIHRLLVERNNFNIQWNRTIGKLVKGKEYLMDIFEIAAIAFRDRDDCIRKLDVLKWKGMFQLNKDIAEMQSYEGEINHLAKLEEFLRVKGSRRICEADEIEEVKRQEEIQRCESEIARHDALLGDIFLYSGSKRVLSVVNNFQAAETRNFQLFVLLCEVLQETIFLRRDLSRIRQLILDQRDVNEAREEMQTKRLASMRLALNEQRQKTEKIRELDTNTHDMIAETYNAFYYLLSQAKCDTSSMDVLLGNFFDLPHLAEIWIMFDRESGILEGQIKSLIEICYSAVKPPAQTPKGRKALVPVPNAVKLVADPCVVELRPNRIQKLVPYQPCAYCVEDYIMNLVSETLSEPADRAFVEKIFHLEAINTKFGIYTLTNPGKRHPYRQSND